MPRDNLLGLTRFSNLIGKVRYFYMPLETPTDEAEGDQKPAQRFIQLPYFTPCAYISSKMFVQPRDSTVVSLIAGREGHEQ